LTKQPAQVLEAIQASYKAFLPHRPPSDNGSLTYFMYAMMRRTGQGDHPVRSALFGVETDHEGQADMSFADQILTEDLEPLRQRLLTHPLWTGIEQGTLPREILSVFALQDWWLVREAYRLDALSIAGMPDLDLQDLLLAKLMPKIGGYRLLLRFGEALGLSRADFDAVEPLAGCMALTTFFYWMLSYGSVPEKIAAVGASEDIFIQICARVGPALMRHYGMSTEQVAFFTAHEEIGLQVTPIDALLMARYQTAEDRRRISRAVRLSHEFELLFYETVMAATTSVK
jgi:pyrroloquinoline-quinone synthase